MFEVITLASTPVTYLHLFCRTPCLNLDYSTEHEVQFLGDPQHQHSSHLNGFEHHSEQTGADEQEFTLTAEGAADSLSPHDPLEGSKSQILADEGQAESQALVEEAIADATNSVLGEEQQQQQERSESNLFPDSSPDPDIPAVAESHLENGAGQEPALPDPYSPESSQTEEFQQEAPLECLVGSESQSQPVSLSHVTDEGEEASCEHYSQLPLQEHSQVFEQEEFQQALPEGDIFPDPYQEKEAEESVDPSGVTSQDTIHEKEEEEKKEEQIEQELEPFEQQLDADVDELPSAPPVSAPVVLATDCEATPEAPPLEEVEHTFGDEGEGSPTKSSEMASVEFVSESHRYVPEHCGPEAYDHAHHERVPGDEVEHYELGPATEHPPDTEHCSATTRAVAINEALPMPVPVYQAQFEPQPLAVPTPTDAVREHEGYPVEDDEEGRKTFQDIRQDLERRK
nr:unnamed protein product [Spirometra erinaceieuropaei]